MQEFLSQSESIKEMVSFIQKSVLWELLEEYPSYRYFDTKNLTRTMKDIYQNSKRPFVVIIDEWDCIFREPYIFQITKSEWNMPMLFLYQSGVKYPKH